MIQAILSHYAALTIGGIIGFFAAAVLSAGKDENDG